MAPARSGFGGICAVFLHARLWTGVVFADCCHCIPKSMMIRELFLRLVRRQAGTSAAERPRSLQIWPPKPHPSKMCWSWRQAFHPFIRKARPSGIQTCSSRSLGASLQQQSSCWASGRMGPSPAGWENAKYPGGRHSGETSCFGRMAGTASVGTSNLPTITALQQVTSNQ